MRKVRLRVENSRRSRVWIDRAPESPVFEKKSRILPSIAIEPGPSETLEDIHSNGSRMWPFLSRGPPVRYLYRLFLLNCLFLPNVAISLVDRRMLGVVDGTSLSA